MKGFVFTLDALFALMIAAAGISILYYFTYTAPNPYFLQYSTAGGLLNRLASTRLDSLSNVSLVSNISQQYGASNQTWPMSIGNPYNNGGNNYGPGALTIGYVVAANAPIINGTIVADYGNVYFGAGNVIYAVNVSSGSVVWTSNTPYSSSIGKAPYVNATLLYGGMLIYATEANIVALNAYNGTQIWSTNTPYALSGEPNGHESKMKMIQYNGKVISYTYDYSNPSTSSLIFSMYASNGTVAGSAPLNANAIQYLAISNGQLLFVSVNFINAIRNVEMATQIINSTYIAANVWAISPACSSLGGLATYSNIITFGCGLSGNIINTNSNYLSSDSYSTPVYGLSVYNGDIAFQTLGQVSLATPTSALWTQASGYSAIYNATPVISKQGVYSLWNGYLLMQNLSTGNTIASTKIPYPGTTNPYMALAYGRLFVSKGQYLMEFGACPANPNESVLGTLGTMYSNGKGSCADYLLNRLQGNSIIAITLGGSSIQSAAQFNGQNSNINLNEINQEEGTNSISYAVWFNELSLPGPYPMIFGDTCIIPRNGYDIYIGGPGSGLSPFLYAERFVGGSWTAGGNSIKTISPNMWYFAVLTYDGAAQRLYLNGTLQSTSVGTGSISIDSAMTLGSCSGTSNYGNEDIANFQIYSSALSAQQISQLYQEGLTGAPISTTNLLGWWPLQGDTNNYAGTFSASYPTNVAFNSVTYNSTSLQNAFSISSQSVPVPVLNYSTGKYKLYNIGVYSWR